jgi:DNA repair exonuclease SbcCD ATPase subunit
MKLQLKTFEFSNIFAYGAGNTLILDKDRVTVVTGQNGAGKSSLPNAIEEILYNKNSRGIKKASVKNRYTNDPMVLKLVFELDGTEYVILKETKTTAKVKFFEAGKDISGHTATQTYKLIEEKIGLDFATFTKLVYQSTKSSLDFLSATDANRKKFLIGLLGLEKYAKIEEQLKDSLKVANKKKDTLKGELAAIERILSKTTEIPDVEEEREVPDGSEIDELTAKVTELNIESTQLSDTNRKIENANNKKTQLESEVTKAERSVSNLVEVDVAPDVQDELAEGRTRLTEVSTKMASEKSTYQRFKSDAEQTECPTCGSSLDKTEASAAMLSAKSRWLELKDSRDGLQRDVDELEVAHKANTDYTLYVAKKKRLDDAVVTASKNLGVFLEANVDYIGGEIKDLYEISDEMSDLRGTITSLKNEITKIQEANRHAVVSNTKRNQLLQQISEAKEQLTEAELNFSEVCDDVAELEILTKAFGPKGLVAYRIEHSVKAVEEGINKYLSVMTDGRFALGFELDGAKLQVVIYDNGEQVEVNSLSTGQFTKVQLSTLLAIRKVLSAVSSVDVNFLFIDETVSFLDEQSKDTLVDVLLKEDDLNVFLVSHGYDHPLTRAMRVTSKDSISHIEV